MKSFLKPSLLKVILTLALFIAASYLSRTYIISRISDTFPWGFPFQFYLAWGPCPPGEICFEYNMLYFFLDTAIWYLVSAFIVGAITKIRKSE